MCSEPMAAPSRRRALLAAATGVVAGALAGCSDPDVRDSKAPPNPATPATSAGTTAALPSSPSPPSPPVVALAIDDYPRPTLEILAPLLAQRALPWTWALNADTFDPGYMYAPWSTGLSWPDVAALAPATVEVANHGASHRDVTDPAAVAAEITGSLARLRAALPGRAVQGWVPPGCDYPGLALKTPPMARGAADYVPSVAGRLILNDHAWAVGQDRRPEDAAGPVITWPRDGLPVAVPGRQWLDFPHGAGLQAGGDPAGGFGGLCVAAAIARGHGTILGLHAAHLVGQGGQDRYDLAQLTRFLDHLAGLRDADQIAVVRLSDWMTARVPPR